ncbi:MAG: hypothetical protein C5B55_04040 [Blastocatellia bacterium]|nr:MAG: hypothetical protein C5B55_04040 [Blastocatellia bacterium]
MAERRIDVFFYGLFMDRSLLLEKGVVPTNERNVFVKDFALKIGQRATLVPEKNGKVYGVVMSLTHSELGHLYNETSLGEYRPEAVLVNFDNGTSGPALCFNLSQAPTADEHSEAYAQRLRALANTLGFPSDYVASIL